MCGLGVGAEGPACEVEGWGGGGGGGGVGGGGGGGGGRGGGGGGAGGWGGGALALALARLCATWALALTSLRGTVLGTMSLRNSRLSMWETAEAGGVRYKWDVEEGFAEDMGGW